MRWDVLGLTGSKPECTNCGEPLKPERRRPGRSIARRFERTVDTERRDVAPPAA